MEKVVSKDGTNIAFRRAGVGPPLVLVHGTGGSSTRWAPVSAAFESRFTIYATDRRGRGESGDSSEYSMEREFEDVLAVVDAIREPVYLLGHSYGAICSLEAALLTTQVVKLVLYEPPIPVEGVPIYSPGIIDCMESLSVAGKHAEVLSMFLRDVVRMPPSELDALQKSSRWPAAMAAAHTLPRELRSHERYRFDPERFKNMSVPTLLLIGGDSPRIFKAAIETLSAALPNNRVVVLPGQQHIAMDTAPDLFVREVLRFLE